MNEKFELEVLTRLAVIENKLDDYKMIKQKAEEAYNMSMQNSESISEINDRSKWLHRTTLGTLITGIASILLIYLKLGIGV